MTALNRRHLLQVAGGGLVLALAGCSDQNEQATDADGNAADIVDTTTIKFATRASRPDWFSEAGADVGEVVVMDSRERAEAVLWPNEGVPEQRRMDISDFLDETDFQTEVVVFVESVGKNLCYNEIAIEDGGLDGDAISVTATVRDTSERDAACGPALIFPSVLVRVSFVEEPVTEAAIDVVDSWGNEATVSLDGRLPWLVARQLSKYVRAEGEPELVPESLDCDLEGITRVQSWIDDNAVTGALASPSTEARPGHSGSTTSNSN